MAFLSFFRNKHGKTQPSYVASTPVCGWTDFFPPFPLSLFFLSLRREKCKFVWSSLCRGFTSIVSSSANRALIPHFIARRVRFVVDSPVFCRRGPSVSCKKKTFLCSVDSCEFVGRRMGKLFSVGYAFSFCSGSERFNTYIFYLIFTKIIQESFSFL